MRVLLRFVAVLLVVGVAPKARAELLEGELQVLGMSCPFCAFGIEKKLRAVDGVSDVTVFLDDGRISIRFNEGNSASPVDIERAVAKSGFELSGLHAKVRGVLIAEAEGMILDAGNGIRFRLQQTTGLPNAASTVVVRGEVKDPESAVPRLAVTNVVVAEGEN